VQALVVAVQFAFQRLDTRRQALALALPALGAAGVGEQRFELLADVADHRFAVAVDVVEHDDALAQALGHQALVHHFQGGVLLADDQQAALAADGVGDHVDDGLALAGTGRAFHQQPRALPGLQHGGLLGRVAGHGEVALQLRRALAGFRLAVLAQAQRGLQAGAGGRQALQLAQVLADSLAHEGDVEQHRGAGQLVLVGRDLGGTRRQSFQHPSTRGGEQAEGIHHVGGAQRGAAEQFVGDLAPALARLGAEQAFQGRVEAHFLALAVEGQRHLATAADFQLQLQRPQQQRHDARAGGAARVAVEQEGEAQVEAVDAGVALVQRALPGQRVEPHFQLRVGEEAVRVEAHRAGVALQQVVEQSGGGASRAIQFVEVDAWSALADAHAHQRPAHHRGDHFLLEEIEDLRHVLLLLRFQPLFRRDRQQHQDPRQRHAPLQAELLGPFVDPGHAAAGEAADAFVDAAVQLLPRVLQQAACGLRVEQVHIGVAGQAGGFLDDRLGGTELADVGAEQDDQVFLGDHPALGQGQQAGVLGVRQEALALLPLRGEARPRGRQQVDAQLFFGEFDVLVQGALADVLGAGLEPRQPAFGVQLFEQVGHRAADQPVALQRMLQQPAGGDDLAALDQRDFRVQQLERQHQPEVVLQPLVLGHLAQAGEQPGRQADVLGPGDDRPAQQVVEGLRPVLGLGRGQGEDRRLA